MKTFTIKPTIQVFDTFAEFAKETNFGPKDCIFTVQFLKKAWIEPLGVRSAVLCFEDYGMGEPTDEMIDKILADFRKLDCTRIIAIGGGSVIDIAKILALKPTGSALNYFEKSVEIVKEKEVIIVPTTCGTGSEVTNISIAGIPSKNTKMGLAVEQLFADKAVIIPELAAGLPEFVLITSAVDALVHALESYVSPRSHAYPEVFSKEAVRMIVRAFRTFLAEGRKACVPKIIKDLMIASNYAGIAFGNTGVGAVHALSYPLGGVHHVPHGEANSRFLMAVFNAYKAKNPTGKITELTALLREAFGITDSRDPWAELEKMVDALLPKKSLSAHGMTAAEIESFADSVVATQQRLLVNNYVPLSRDEIRDIYKSLF